MALSFRNSEMSFQESLRSSHKQGTVFPLGKTAIIKDDPEAPAFVALVLEPNGDSRDGQGTVAYTAPATQWVQIAREILRTLSPTSEDEILRHLEKIQGPQDQPS